MGKCKDNIEQKNYITPHFLNIAHKNLFGNCHHKFKKKMCFIAGPLQGQVFDSLPICITAHFNILYLKSGYAGKFSLSPQEITWALPPGFPSGSGYISQYIHLLVT